MGILNVTPDSFSDGGVFFSVETATRRAGEMIRDGARLIDIGGESTRPGHNPVDGKEEIRRVIPVIKRIVEFAEVPISIDTSKAEVAEEAMKAGASVINDVWGLRREPDIARVAAESHSGLIIMFNNRERNSDESAQDIVSDAIDYLSKSVDIALRAGVKDNSIMIDPGIGFGMSHRQSFALIRGIPTLSRLGFPVLVGPSRKRFIGAALGNAPVDHRDIGTVAVSCLSAHLGADVIRTHNVRYAIEALSVTDIISKKHELEED